MIKALLYITVFSVLSAALTAGGLVLLGVFISGAWSLSGLLTSACVVGGIMLAGFMCILTGV